MRYKRPFRFIEIVEIEGENIIGLMIKNMEIKGNKKHLYLKLKAKYFCKHQFIESRMGSCGKNYFENYRDAIV